MNSLLLFPEEVLESGRVVLAGERAQRIFSGHRFEVGQVVCAALYGGDKIRLQVEFFSEDSIELQTLEREQSLPLRPLDLIVGLSRPQTTKKVIHTAVMAGVRSLHLVATERGEKSYLDSHILRPADLQCEVVKALEQIWEGHVPEIRVHRSFVYFSKHTLKNLSGRHEGLLAIALPGASLLNRVIEDRAPSSAVFAVGPEAGWSDGEVCVFQEHGFLPVGLGLRIVRVETALSFLLGQSLLFDGC